MRIPGVPGGVVPERYDADWSRVARLIVHESLQVGRGERVLVHADPTYFPELAEQVRIEIVRAGAVELAAMMFYPPGLAEVRRRLGVRDRAELSGPEDAALEQLFALADVYIWLPRAWSHNRNQTETLLQRWPGRALHFHWVPSYVTPVEFRALSAQLERALLVDRSAIARTQQQLADRLAGAEVTVSTPAGTELTFTVAEDAYLDHGNGDASKQYIATHSRPGVARDRERELPCGLVGTVNVSGGDGHIVYPRSMFGGRPVGALTVTMSDGRVMSMSSERHSDWVAGLWQLEKGDRDRFGGLYIGTNPELRPLPHVDEVPYWGSGAGVVRLTIGDNIEAGGTWDSTFMLGHWLTDATLSADGRVLVKNGDLVEPDLEW